MESKSIYDVTEWSNTCTTTAGHTEDDMAYLCSQNPEGQHQVPGAIHVQGFPYISVLCICLFLIISAYLVHYIKMLAARRVFLVKTQTCINFII